MNYRKIIFLTVLCFYSLSAQKKILTLPQAISQGLKANFDIIRSENLRAMQDVAASNAKWALIPSINFSASGAQSKSNKDEVIYGSFTVPNPSNSFSSSIGSSVVLFDGMSNWVNVSKATTNYEATSFDHLRTQQLIVFDIQRKYFTVLRTKSLLQVNEDNLKRSQQQLKRIEEANRLGAVAKADLYRQQVATANDELNLIRTKNSFDNSYTDLLTVLSIDLNEDFELEEINIESEINAEKTKQLLAEFSDVKNMVTRSVSNRPDFQSSMLAISSASSDVTIARSSFWPTISASMNLNMNADTLSELTNKNTTTFGLNFSFPLFSNFRTSTAVEQAQLKLQTSEEQHNQTKRKIHSEVKKSVLDLESSQKQRDVSQKNIIAATEDRRIAEERYNLGAGTLLDLLIANANYTKALSDKVNADYDFLIAKQQLILALGEERY